MIMMLSVMCMYQMTGWWSWRLLIMPLCLSQISRIECCIIYKSTRYKTKLRYLKERSKKEEILLRFIGTNKVFCSCWYICGTCYSESLTEALSRCTILDSGHVGTLGKMWYAIVYEYPYKYLTFR
jgi:hypothetical protein